MKKIILLTAYCLLLTPMIATLAWADGWVTQTTTTSAFYDVYALEERVCFAVGQNGLVAGTSNMGATWNTSTFSSGVSNLDWYDVHFNNASQGFIVGESGSSARVNYVSSTGSFELSAASVAFPLTAHLYGCYYFSATSIFAVGAYSGAGGNLVYKNDGNNWVASATGINENCHFKGVDFANSLTGWVVGGKTDGSEKVVYKTVNGGTTWSKENINSSGTGTFEAWQVIAADDVWVAGSGGKVFHYDGTSWSDKSLSATTNLSGVYFKDANNGWVGGSSGAMYKTTDGGTSWSSDGSLTYDIRSIAGSEESTWAAGAGSGRIFAYAVAPAGTSLSTAQISSAGTSQSFTTRISGSNFRGRIGTALSPAVNFSYSGLNVDWVSFESSSSLLVSVVATADAIAGIYDVTILNPDKGEVEMSNAFEILPSSLQITKILIDGQEVASNQVSVSQRSWQNNKGPTIHVEVIAPTPLAAGLSAFALPTPITGEATIGSNTEALTFDLSGNLGSSESKQLSASLGAGSYSSQIKVYWSGGQVTESFTLVVVGVQAQEEGGYTITDPVPEKAVVSPGETISVDVVATENQLVDASFIGVNPHICTQQIDFSKARIRSQATSVEAGVKKTIQLTVPTHIARGVYTVVFTRGGRPVARPGSLRLAVGVTSN